MGKQSTPDQPQIPGATTSALPTGTVTPPPSTSLQAGGAAPAIDPKKAMIAQMLMSQLQRGAQGNQGIQMPPAVGQ